MYTSTSSTTYFPPNPSTSSSSSPPDDDRDVPSTQPPPQQHTGVIVRSDNLAAQQMLQSSGILADRTPETPYSYYSEIYGNLPLFFTPEWSQMITPTDPIFRQLGPAYPGPAFVPPHPHPYEYPPNIVMPARRTGGRRPKEEMQPEMEDEEYDKKLKRRQRNKEAAARCRQRRLELMQTLQDQVDKQKDDNRKKDVQIKDLRNQINELHRFLQNHDCKMSPEQRQAHMNISIPNTSQNIPPPSSSPQTHPVQSTAISTNALSGAHSGGPLLPPQTHMTQPMKARNISTKVPSYSLPLVSSDRKRPLPHADVFAAKLPKPEQTLAQLNMNGTEDLARPDRLFDMPSTNASVGSSSSTILVTPSHGLGSTPYQPNNSLSGLPFGNIAYTPGGAPNLLDGPTGITPITNNPVPIFEARITGDVRGDLESL